MRLTAIVDFADRSVLFGEAHSLVSGDLCEPLVVDFSRCPRDVADAVDTSTLALTLRRGGSGGPVVASVPAFSAVPGRSYLRSSVLSLANEAMAAWFRDASSGDGKFVVDGWLEVSDALVTYVACPVPVVLRDITPRGDVSGYYTASQVDALLALKQALLSFDPAPAESSANPVTSGGVFAALAAKASQSWVETALSGKVGTADLAAALAGYATTAALGEAVAGLEASLASKAELAAAVADLATKAELAAAVADLVTQSDLSSAVADLATKAELAAAVADLVTQSDLSSAVAGLVTQSALSAALALKADAADLDALSGTVDGKADADAVEAALALKADAAAVESALAGKVGTAALAEALALKADASALGTLSDSVDALSETVGGIVSSSPVGQAAFDAAVALLATKAELAAVEATIAGYVTREWAEAQLATKANASEVTTALAGKVSQAELSAAVAGLAAQSAVDALAAALADKVGSAALAAALADYATQEWAEAQLATKAGASEMASALAAKADASDVEAALALKADASALDDITGSLALKADKSDTYTKAEVDALVAGGGGGGQPDVTFLDPEGPELSYEGTSLARVTLVKRSGTSVSRIVVTGADSGPYAGDLVLTAASAWTATSVSGGSVTFVPSSSKFVFSNDGSSFDVPVSLPASVGRPLSPEADSEPRPGHLSRVASSGGTHDYVERRVATRTPQTLHEEDLLATRLITAQNATSCAQAVRAQTEFLAALLSLQADFYSKAQVDALLLGKGPAFTAAPPLTLSPSGVLSIDFSSMPTRVTDVTVVANGIHFDASVSADGRATVDIGHVAAGFPAVERPAPEGAEVEVVDRAVNRIRIRGRFSLVLPSRRFGTAREFILVFDRRESAAETLADELSEIGDPETGLPAAACTWGEEGTMLGGITDRISSEGLSAIRFYEIVDGVFSFTDSW